ncbi:hypothetical protein P4O66_003401 [Electrophorus voltai]|uniref:Receptor ligand binding region domain-containing protein n=1 Tax=Electrophorus voltai TaxID=2609070 RepID=A0AAD8YPC6_9TELE|nr:hypothetical protein P4O66_003401 [Electrophorus voltai]
MTAVMVNGQPEKERGASCADVRRQPSPVIVGDASSGVSMAVLRTLGSFQIPLVSYFASCSCLSNKKEFPSFMRTMPSDEFQIKALAKLVHYFQWSWVGLIGVDLDYARFAIQLFLKESVRYNVCPAYVHFYPVILSKEALRELMNIIRDSTATVILNFSRESTLQTILQECRRQNITHLQWIASEAWATSNALWGDFSDLLQGTLGFAIRKGEIPSLYRYLTLLNTSNIQTSHFLSEFWEDTFNCRVNGSLNTHIHRQEALNRVACTGRESLDDVYTLYSDVSQLRVSYNVYKAVYLIAHALHDMSTCVPGQGPFHNGTCGSLKYLLPWQLLSYMKRANFTTLGEDVSFDEHGDPIASYDLMSWQVASDGSLQLVKVGFYDASLKDETNLVINDSVIMWHSGNKGEEGSQSFYQDGDVILGGLFPLHYSPVPTERFFQSKPAATEYKDFSSRALRWMRTMTFAVAEINQRQDLLPKLSLGYHIHDSCDDIPVSVKRSLLLVNGQPEKERGASCADVRRQPSPVIVGDASSGVSMAVLRTLGSFQIPLVSYFASCSCLSNKKEFPSFMRTMPSDEFQIKALAKLVHYFQWSWVGLIGADSDYARFAIQLFLKESVRYNVCPAYVHFYPVILSKEALRELMNIIRDSTATVILNFSSESTLQTILQECRRQNITHLQWIASEAWATSNALWGDFSDLLQGTLGFAIRKGEIPSLYRYLTLLNTSNIQTSHFLSEFWEDTFNCRVNGSLNTHIHRQEALNRVACTGRESLDDVYTLYSDVSQLRVSYNVYKAVYLIAHALHDMSTCVPGQGPFHNGTCGSLKYLLPWQLLSYMKRANFTTLGEDVSFDEHGDPIASYDLMSWQVASDGSLQLVKVGFYDASLKDETNLVINDSVIMWHSGNKKALFISHDLIVGGRKYSSLITIFNTFVNQFCQRFQVYEFSI